MNLCRQYQPSMWVRRRYAAIRLGNNDPFDREQAARPGQTAQSKFDQTWRSSSCRKTIVYCGDALEVTHTKCLRGVKLEQSETYQQLQFERYSLKSWNEDSSPGVIKE